MAMIGRCGHKMKTTAMYLKASMYNFISFTEVTGRPPDMKVVFSRMLTPALQVFLIITRELTLIMMKLKCYICCRQSSNSPRGIALCRSCLTSSSHLHQSIIHAVCSGCWMVILRCYLLYTDGCLFCWRAAYK